MLPYVLAGGLAVIAARRMLDVMALGDHAAEALGINVARTRLLFVAGASLITAAAVSVAGLIGFVGLVVPHMIRLMAGSSYKLVLPLTALLGAAFLVIADLLARSVIPGVEVPVGVVTAFIGGPFFAYLLIRGREATA